MKAIKGILTAAIVGSAALPIVYETSKDLFAGFTTFGRVSDTYNRISAVQGAAPQTTARLSWVIAYEEGRTSIQRMTNIGSDDINVSSATLASRGINPEDPTVQKQLKAAGAKLVM